jgi:hypothetical protein
MKTQTIKKIAEIIYHSFNSDKTLLSDWIISNTITLSIDGLSDEIIYESFGDTSSNKYDDILKYLNSIIDRHKPSNRILLIDDYGTYLCLSDLGKRIDISCESYFRNAFNCIEKKDRMEKGLIYEKFCTCFLSDLSLDAETTIASNDKGIDIIAKYKSKFPNPNSKLVFNEDIYLVGQSKFLSSKVDTSIIRKLVGDSLFIRFDQLEYLQLAHNAIHLIVFSHNGFTDEAISFCQRNKVMRIDTTQMISILSSFSNPETTKSYEYIKSII